MVDKDKRYDELISGFVTHMYRKGYRKTFTLDALHSERIYLYSSLSQCLKLFVNLYLKSGKTKDCFELETKQDYKSPQDNITCWFKVALDETKGFKVREVIIRDALSGQQRTYRLNNNNQVPGAASLYGLFSRPKPWEEFWKGKRRFRP